MLYIFNELAKYNISPNQYYMLLSIKEGLSCPQVNEAQEIRVLKGKGYILDSGKLSSMSLQIISEIESIIKPLKEKTTKAILGSESKEYIEQYRELWNMGKLPSGVPARVNKKEIEAKFQKFFTKFPEYTWEEVINATKYYIDEFERNNPPYIYMQNSSYFISKMTQDKTIQYTLANYIELIKSGDDEFKDNHFKEKVV